MATTAILPNNQQQQQPAIGDSTAALPNDQTASASSGSIAPFFAVISVLTVLAILSCYFGRRYGRRAAVPPLERIDVGGGFFGWVKSKCRRCWGGHSHDIEIGKHKNICGDQERFDANKVISDGENISQSSN